MPITTFEDLTPGLKRRFGAYRVTQDEIIAFAREYDPQSFHVDPATPGGLIASGWHTCSMTMRMIFDGFMRESTALGAPGIDEVRWLRPVRPGMVLSAEVEVREARVSRSRPEMGLVSVLVTVADETGEPVMTQANWVLFGRRDPAAPFEATPAPPRPPPAPEPPQHADEGVNATRFATYYEDIEIGARADLGRVTFQRDDMLRFARAYDPQPFHLDDAAAARSHFGRLAASGWLTGASWMRRFVEASDRAREAAAARGEALFPALPSPGLNDLRWLRPVHPGDVIAYDTTILGKRPSSRAGFGKLFARARGYNQEGALTFELQAVGLAPMRG